jgi:hypothetical protein
MRIDRRALSLIAPMEAWRFRVPMEIGRSWVYTFGPDGVGLISRFAEDGGLQCSNGYPAYPAPRLVWGRVELPEPAAVSYPADEVPGPL